MSYDEWKQESPNEQPFEKELPTCEACGEEAEWRTELAIERPGLKLNAKSMVCEDCLGKLHEELIINHTE